MVICIIAGLSAVLSFVNLIVIFKVDRKLAEMTGKGLFHEEVKDEQVSNK